MTTALEPQQLTTLPQGLEYQPITPLFILHDMAKSGADPAAIRDMSALAERWKQIEAAAAFNAGMSACQADIQTVVCDDRNPNTKSKFAKLETVQRIAKPVYTNHGFSLSFSEGKPDKPNHMRIVCTVRHKEGHQEQHYIELPYDGIGPKGERTAMNPVQGVGSTYSYGCRYLTVRIFNMVIADEDTDGNGAEPKLSGEQIKEINELLAECRKLGKEVDFDRFLAWLGVTDLADVPERDFVKAVRELNRKRRS